MPIQISVIYERTVDDELYRNWKHKRHTGMKVSWWHEMSSQDELEPDYIFHEENKYFTLLANIIHENGGITQDMKDLLKEIREKKKLVKSECEVGKLPNESRNSIDKRFGNISNGAIYKEEISEENLEISAGIYFEIVFCPNLDPDSIQFYQNLFKNFPLETILKTFTRILLEANEKKLTDQYQAAKTLFDQITEMMNLQYRHIAILTTGLTDLKHYPELKGHQLNEEMQSKNKDFSDELFKPKKI